MKIRLRKNIKDILVKPVSWSKVNLGKQLIASDDEELDMSKTYGYYQDMDSKDDITLSTWNKGFISVVKHPYPFFEVEEKTSTPIEEFLMKKKSKILINLYGSYKWNLVTPKNGEVFNTNNLAKVSKNRQAIISIRSGSTHFYCLDLEIQSELLLNRIHKFESPNLIVRSNGRLEGLEDDNIAFRFLNNQKKEREVYHKLVLVP
jgi:hypothetical protein